MTPEAKVKKKLKGFFDHIGAWQYWPVSNGMGKHGVPDCIACVNRFFVAIEVKAPGRRGQKNMGCSALQVVQLKEISQALGFTLVFDGGEDQIEHLCSWVRATCVERGDCPEYREKVESYRW